MSEIMNQDNENKKNNGMLDKLRASFTGRKFRTGVYVSLLTTVVFVIVLVINLITSKMDLKVDLSTQDLYTITDQTKSLLSGLEDDITIYYLAESGNESSYFQKIAERYDSYSDHITLEQKDPMLYPKFASQYVDDEITTNSFLVINNTNQRAKYVDNSEMLVKEFDYNTYETNTTGIDVEGKLTSAIQYVITSELPVLYATTGHAEKETGEIFQEYMGKQNVTVKTTATLTEDIPEDSEILFINAPQSDFTEDEIAKIKDYMADGGNVIMVVDYKAESMPNLQSLLEYYGIQFNQGIVCEGDTSKYVTNFPHYIVPDVLSHEITNGTVDSNRYIIMPYSSGLSLLESRRSSLTIEPLLTTSDQAYSKVNLNANTLEKEEGDTEGPFYLGLLATDTYKDVTSNMIVYASGMVFDESSIGQYGNATLLTDSVAYLSGDIGAVSVRTRSLVPESIYVTQKQGIFWGSIVVVILPVLILGAGIFVTLRRRKR